MGRLTIYMYLPDEAVDTWRPVEAEELTDGYYRVLGPAPHDECWEFAPGSLVRIIKKELYEGCFWVAVDGVFPH